MRVRLHALPVGLLCAGASCVGGVRCAVACNFCASSLPSVDGVQLTQKARTGTLKQLDGVLTEKDAVCLPPDPFGNGCMRTGGGRGREGACCVPPRVPLLSCIARQQYFPAGTLPPPPPPPLMCRTTRSCPVKATSAQIWTLRCRFTWASLACVADSKHAVKVCECLCACVCALVADLFVCCCWQAILENVVFCHQEDSNWPMQVPVLAGWPGGNPLCRSFCSCGPGTMCWFPCFSGWRCFEEKVRRNIRVHAVQQGAYVCACVRVCACVCARVCDPNQAVRFPCRHWRTYGRPRKA
jgi:hypothetical protein